MMNENDEMVDNKGLGSSNDDKEWMESHLFNFILDVAEKSTQWFISTVYDDKKYNKTFETSVKHILSPFYDYPIFPNRPNKERNEIMDGIIATEKEIGIESFATLNMWNAIVHKNGLQSDLAAYDDDSIAHYISVQSKHMYYFLNVLWRIKCLNKQDMVKKPSMYIEEAESFFDEPIIKNYWKRN